MNKETKKEMKKHLKNDTKARVIIESLKISIAPFCVSSPITDEELENKDVLSYIANEILEVIEMCPVESAKLRREAWEKTTNKVDKINDSFLSHVSSRELRSRNEVVAVGDYEDIASSNANNPITSKDGIFIQSGGSPTNASVSTTSELLKQTDEKMTAEYERMAAELKNRKESNEVVTPEKKSIDGNIDEVLSSKDESIEEIKDDSGSDFSKEVIEFGSKPFFSKKSIINKSTDVGFLKELLKSEKNDTVLKLTRQKLEELK